MAVSSSCRCFKHSCLRHTWRPPQTSFWPFEFPTCLRHACLLGWPLSSYKPGSPHALTCSPLRACQSCLPGAQRLIRVAPISHLLCGLLALSSAPLLYSLHRLVSQSTRNMIDWLGFLFPCAFLHTTNSPVAYGVRVCKLLPCSKKPCTAYVLLCSPHRARQSCLSDAWCVFLLPSRAYAIRVCPTLGCSLSCGRINATRCEAVSSLCRCFWHSCLLCSVLATPAVPAMRVCPSFSCLSHELLPSVSAQSLTRVAPARH